MTAANENILALSPHKGAYKASAALSFDYESSAVYGDLANWKSRLRGTACRLLRSKRDLSYCYGLGYAMRSGADKIQKIFKKYGARGTWFATGHALLEGNKNRNAFRIDQLLPYATAEAGFSDIVSWRENLTTFHFEKYSDFRAHPYWYSGDQTRRLAEQGNDIQCHTFSHPHVALESPENMAIDIEDWQKAARANHLQPATIFAFPFAGDCYRHYRDSGMKALHWKERPEAFELRMLSHETINILANNGIELVTRCASKSGQRLTGFAPYQNSKLYFMTDFDIAGLLHDVEGFSQILSEIIKHGHTIDFWLHPSNVFTEREARNFENIVRQLMRKNETHDLWFAPIRELWQHYKHVQSCRLETRKVEEAVFTIFIKNGGTETVHELSCHKSTPGKLSTSFRGVTETEQKIIIGKLNPGEQIQFLYTSLMDDNGHAYCRTTSKRTLAS